STMLVHRPEFLPEIWFLYAVGTFWLILRFFVRIRTRGLCGLEPDDAFSFLVLICWTNMCVGIQITYYTGAAVDYTPEDMVDFTQSHLEQVEYGTKLYFMTMYAILMVFSLKGTVISFYERLAFCNWQNLLLKWTKVYCVLGFIAITCVLSFSCWPYSRNWAVRPYPGLECTAKPQFFIVLSCLNASGDALLLCIPIPLFWRLRLPLLKKIGMVILLSSGIFVMAACIIRVSLTVVPDVSLRIIARWGVRELSIGILAVNTAALRPSKPFFVLGYLSILFPLEPSPDFRLFLHFIPIAILYTSTNPLLLQCSTNPSGNPTPREKATTSSPRCTASNTSSRGTT
ncbi:hypothetical protein K504DRAFT_374326, partial [Pleomassaria siparia CBS 279.74]